MLAFLAALQILGGCAATTTTIQATRAVAYQGAPKRMIVVAVLAKGSAGVFKSLQSHLATRLRVCGVENETIEDDAVPIGTPVKAPDRLNRFVMAQVQQYKPDSVLFIQQTWIEGHKTSDGISPMNATYMLALDDVTTKSMVWQGEVRLAHAGDFSDIGDLLAESIANRMSGDGLLPRCPSTPIAGSVAPTPGLQSDPLAQAKAARERGEYLTAVSIFRRLADQGNAEATARLADMYDLGQGVLRDRAESAILCGSIADRGYKPLTLGFQGGTTVTICAASAKKPTDAPPNLSAAGQSPGTESGQAPATPAVPAATETGSKTAGAPQNRHAFLITKGCSSPIYPPESRAAHEQGTAVVSFRIATDGHVVESKILTSSGYPRLDDAALSALTACRFEPQLIDGLPVEGWSQMTFRWMSG